MKKNKKKAFKMRSDFEKAIELEKTMANYTEEEIAAIEEWLDMLDDKLRKVSLDAMLKFARDKGQVQAFLIGLARFTYRIIKDMEDFGLSAKGNIWDFYYLALLPIAHDIENMQEGQECH